MAYRPFGIDPAMIPPPGYDPSQNASMFSYPGSSGFLPSSPGTRGGGSFLAPMGTGARGGVGALPQWGQPPPDPWAIPQYNIQQMQAMSSFVPTPTQQIQTMYANTGAPQAQQANARAAAGQPKTSPTTPSSSTSMTDVLAALAQSITSSQAAGATTYQPSVSVTPVSASITSTTNPNIGMK